MPDYLIIYVAQQLVLIDEPIKNSQIFGTLDPFGRQTSTRGRKIDAWNGFLEPFGSLLKNMCVSFFWDSLQKLDPPWEIGKSF